MKTMKLAVSVYALTLALVSNGAWAAIGQANPSCDANTFKLSYNDNMTGCLGYATSPTNTTSTNSTLTWNGVFKTSAAVPTGGGTCLGYELTGWKGNEVKVNNGVLALNTGYTNDSETWNTIPKADGTSTYGLVAVWTPTTQEITLNSDGADSNSDPATIWRRGNELFLAEDAQVVMTAEQQSLTAIPKKHGYRFRGFYQSETRANDVGNMWLNGEDEFTNEYCNRDISLQQSNWASTTSELALKCAWIYPYGSEDSARGVQARLGNPYVGTAAAAMGTTELYAAWAPRTFKVLYKKGGVDAGDPNTGFCSLDGNCITGETNKAQPSNEKITLMNGVEADINYECRYGAEEYPQNSAAAAACLPTGNPTTTLSDTYAFSGWSYSISYYNGKGFDFVTQSTDLITETSELKEILPTIITSFMTKDGKTFDNFYVTITAHWTGANREVNIYPYYGSDAEPLKYYFWVNRGWYKKNDTSLEKVDEFDISQFTAPKAQNGVGTEFRGLALRYDSAKTGDDKSADPTSIVDETSNKFIMPNIQAATLPSGTYMLADKTGEWKSVDTTANQQAVTRLFNDVYLNDSSVKIYGTWAQKCNPLNAQSRCNLDISHEGEVTYVNTCDTGYNIDGLSVVNGK